MCTNTTAYQERRSLPSNLHSRWRSLPRSPASRTVNNTRSSAFFYSPAGLSRDYRQKQSIKETLLKLIWHLEEERPILFYGSLLLSLFLFGFVLGQVIGGFRAGTIDTRGSQLRTRHSHSHIKKPDPTSPYELHFPGYWLSSYQKKNKKKYLQTISPDEAICFVHVGKTAGSTVGCALGFGLHCQDKTLAPGVLPQHSTKMFHTDEYDCFDDSAYYLFVVRDPLDRLVSAFNYDSPKGRNWKGKREKLYLNCPFDSINNLALFGLSPHGNATEECRHHAGSFVEGAEELGVHSYWNYQFHLEGIPNDARIITIRQTHLIEDWNTIEHLIGGEENILGANQTVLLHRNAAKSARSTNQTNLNEKYLSEESRALICEKLCNEIQVYMKILDVSVNLSEEQVQQSLEELKKSCPNEITFCKSPLPDITEKLFLGRGYDLNVTLDAATREITVGRKQIPANSSESAKRTNS